MQIMGYQRLLVPGEVALSHHADMVAMGEVVRSHEPLYTTRIE